MRRCPDVPNLHQEYARVLGREDLKNSLRPKYNVRKLKTFLTPIACSNNRAHRRPVAHVPLFIHNISHAWFPIALLEKDNYVVKRLDEAPRMHFPGVLSRTRVTEQQFLSLVGHSLRCPIAKTKIPNGVEDFLNAYSQKRSNVDQRQRSAHYQSINTAGGNTSKLAAKPPASGVPLVVPPPLPRDPPPPPKPRALQPMPATTLVVDDFDYFDSASEGQEEVRSDSSLEMPDEEEELGRSTQVGCVARRCAHNPPPPLLGTTRTTMFTRLQCLRLIVGVPISVLSPN